MSETQKSISEWANETFGTAGSNARIAARVNEEMAELLRALTSDDNHPKAPEEAADVVIVLCRLADRFDVNIQPEIEAARDVVSVKPPSNFRAAAHANSEMSHIIFAIADGLLYFTAEMIPRLAARMRFICDLFSTTLQAEIDKKMAINRKRRWTLDNT